MKRLAILFVLCMFILSSGCGYYQAKQAEKQAEEHLEVAEKQLEKLEKQAGTLEKQQQTLPKTTTTRKTKSYDSEPEDDAPEVLNVPTSGDSGSVGLTKLGTQYRDKTASEKCDIDSPFSCMSYVASDGRIDVTIKYTAYKGVVKETSLYFDGDECDPSSVTIEPGDKKKFTCYADEDSSQASGSLEMEYYESLDRAHYTKTGILVANWE